MHPCTQTLLPRYYFAVVECGDEATASQLYSRVDGLEWEHSSAAINCSFIPPDVSFEGRQVRDQAFSTPGERFRGM